jgi:hypothetical protein
VSNSAQRGHGGATGIVGGRPVHQVVAMALGHDALANSRRQDREILWIERSFQDVAAPATGLKVSPPGPASTHIVVPAAGGRRSSASASGSRR